MRPPETEIDEPSLDAAREAALRRIDRGRRLASATVVAIAVLEAILFGALLRSVDFSDHLQVQVLMATSLLFGAICFGLIALGSYVRFWVLRVVGILDLGR